MPCGNEIIPLLIDVGHGEQLRAQASSARLHFPAPAREFGGIVLGSGPLGSHLLDLESSVANLRLRGRWCLSAIRFVRYRCLYFAGFSGSGPRDALLTLDKIDDGSAVVTVHCHHVVSGGTLKWDALQLFSYVLVGS